MSSITNIKKFVKKRDPGYYTTRRVSLASRSWRGSGLIRVGYAPTKRAKPKTVILITAAVSNGLEMVHIVVSFAQSLKR